MRKESHVCTGYTVIGYEIAIYLKGELVRIVATYLLLFLIAVLVIGMPTLNTPAGRATNQGTVAAAPQGAHRYPDFGFLPAAHLYEGRVFQLSQDYPSETPNPAKIPPFCTNDFGEATKNWRQFLMAVRAYCFEGNIQGGDVEDDWRVQENKVRKWYHMPWQHYGPNGREGIHGLTKEAPVQPRQLAWEQTDSGRQTYAVAFYNEFGGYTIGQVWKDPRRPAAGMNKIEFPIGTVIGKLLFVDVPPKQVPFLNPPLTWQGYITDSYESNNRSIRDLSLIQMDIMVRHQNAPMGWLFGTYQSNGKRKGADSNHLWDNLVPLGLQWGNDPDIRENLSNPQPVSTVINDRLRETIINPDADEVPPTHLGWNGRLNGPVDNAMSSCMSCHMAAETPQHSQISPLFETSPPTPGSDAWMRWFQNLRCGERFDEHCLPTDFSLQMAISIQNFNAWRNEGSKMLAKDYVPKQVRARIKEPMPPAPHRKRMHSATGEEEVDIRRDYLAPQGP